MEAELVAETVDGEVLEAEVGGAMLQRMMMSTSISIMISKSS